MGRSAWRAAHADSPDYRPDVDGLRAVAVLLVVLQHGDLMFAGGFIGVDVFFVISGFLITRLILKDCQSGTFTLRGFWLRRVRRIVPAGTVAVAATLAVGAFLVTPPILGQLAESAVAQQCAASNLYFLARGGYFDTPSGHQPLLHTWSLGVEEQFYFVWPLLLVWLWRRACRAVRPVVALLAVASLALSVGLTRYYPPLAFYLMPTRMWQLLLGAAVLFLPDRAAAALGRTPLAGLVGLGLILLPAVAYSAETPFPGLAALLPCLGAALVIASPCRARRSVSGLLAAGPAVFIGLASYSIYLWHWPVMVYARALGFGGLAAAPVVAALGLLAGILSYRFVETPFRQRRLAPSGRQLLLACGGAALAVGVAGVAIDWRVAVRYGRRPTAPERWLARPEPDDPLGVHAPPCDYRVTLGVPGEPTFVVWGDSHAGMIGQWCDGQAKARGLSGACLASVAQAPLLGAWCDRPEVATPEAQVKWVADCVAWIKSHRVRHVTLVVRWEAKLNGLPDSRRGFLCDPLTVRPGPEDARRVLAAGLRRTLGALGGVRLQLVRQVPVQRERAVVSREEWARQQRDFEAVVAGLPSLTVVGPGANWFDREGQSVIGDEGGEYYWDESHLNPRGVERLLGPLLRPVFDAMADDSAGDR
jgi:peptidoglycan/LPS O-acetylase OafA/YrhL